SPARASVEPCTLSLHAALPIYRRAGADRGPRAGGGAALQAHPAEEDAGQGRRRQGGAQAGGAAGPSADRGRALIAAAEARQRLGGPKSTRLNSTHRPKPHAVLL